MAIQDISSQSNRNHAVPQNIMDVEFKIVGDLTMRQFSYILIFGLMAYFNIQVMVGIFKWPLTVFFVLLGLSLAFVPVQDRGLDVWLVNFIKSVYKPTQLIWKKSIVLPTAFLYDNLNVLKQELITLAPTTSRRKLEEFLDYSKKNQPVDPLDIPEAEFIQKVRDAYRNVPRVVPEVVAPVEVVTPIQVATLAPQEEIVNIPQALLEPIADTVKEEVVTLEPVKEIPKEIVTQEVVPVKMPVKPPVAVAVTPIAATAVITPRVIEPVVTYTMPITPDRHSGRRFTSFLPSKGELVLPIRGERVLTSVDQEDIEDDLKVKTEKLQQLLSQIRQSHIKPTKKPEALQASLNTLPNAKDLTPVTQISSPVEPKTVIPPVTVETPKMEMAPLRAVPVEIIPEVKKETPIIEIKSDLSNISRENRLDVAKVTLANLTRKRTDLLNEISNLKNSNAVKFASKINLLQRDLQTVNSQYQDLRSQVQSFESKYFGATSTATKDASEATATNVPALNKPNILWGFVKDTSGKSMQDIVVIIKNIRGEPVRATKTNELGQFILTTPLNNGKYIAEISSGSKKEFSFDSISLEASGNVIPPIEFLGK